MQRSRHVVDSSLHQVRNFTALHLNAINAVLCIAIDLRLYIHCT